MPVSTYPGANSATGNGVTTVFAYSYRILDDDDLLVYVAGTLQTKGTHYSVSGVGDANGGNVTFVTAPSNGAAVVIARQRPYARTEYDYQRNGSFDEETVDADIDSVVMMVQQLYADRLRGFKAPIEVTTDQVLTSALWAARASKILSFDASGNFTLTAAADLDLAMVSAFVATLLDDADAAAFLTTLGVSAYIQTLLNDADAATAQSTLGGTTVGKAVFTAASEAAGRTAIGAAPLKPTVETRTSNTILGAADCGKTIYVTGSWTQTFDAIATLGTGWWVEIINIGTGTLTLDPNGSEKLYIAGGANGGDTTMTLPYSGSTEGPYNVSGVRLSTDGTTGLIATSIREAHGEQLFTASGTWTAPAGVTTIWVDAAGGGGGGGGCANTASSNAGGGGAGAAVKASRQAVVPGTAYTVTIGAGGNGGAAGGANNGATGGTTSLGALISLTGGTGGDGANGAGSAGRPSGGAGGSAGGYGTPTLNGLGGGGIFAGSTTNQGLAASGNSGCLYGGGGNGAAQNAAGGNGAAGFVHIRW